MALPKTKTLASGTRSVINRNQGIYTRKTGWRMRERILKFPLYYCAKEENSKLYRYIILNFTALDYLIGNVKEREFQKYLLLFFILFSFICTLIGHNQSHFFPYLHFLLAFNSCSVKSWRVAASCFISKLFRQFCSSMYKCFYIN